MFQTERNYILRTNDLIMPDPLGESLYHGSYGAELLDPRWKIKRKEILNRDNNQCVICHSNRNLQVHHRQYHFSRSLNKFKKPWEYENRLMITLCESCHQKGHRLYKVPVKYII
jgi:5-methylcytosine-specific restriction endonuclease McrA